MTIGTISGDRNGKQLGGLGLGLLLALPLLAAEPPTVGEFQDLRELTIKVVSSRHAAPVFRAVLRHDQAALEKLLARGPELQVRTEQGVTPLEAAIGLHTNAAPEVRALLQAGADPNFTDVRGSTPLFYALANNEAECAALLLQHGARLERIAGDRGSALAAVAAYRRFDLLPMLFAAGADPREQLPEGHMIHYAARYRQPAIIRGLLQMGEDIDSRAAPHGLTPLMCAVRQGDASAVRAVLAFNPGLDLQDEQGWTALMHAIATDKRGMAELLLAKNADVRAAAPDGTTAYVLAERRGFPDMKQTLLEHGAVAVAVQLPAEAGRLSALPAEQRQPLALAGFELYVNSFTIGALNDGTEQQARARDWLTTHRLNDRASLVTALDELLAGKASSQPAGTETAGAMSEAEFRAKLDTMLDDPAAIVKLKHARQLAQATGGAGESAWNLCHHNFLTVLGVRAGLLEETDGWSRMQEAGRRLQTAHLSWAQIGAVMRRQLMTMEFDSVQLEAITKLFLDPASATSPWQLAPLFL